MLVLIETTAPLGPDQCLGGTFCHIGLAVASRAEVDAGANSREQRNVPCSVRSTTGHRSVTGRYVVDPDGHNLEISFGQEVAFTVEQARALAPLPFGIALLEERVPGLGRVLVARAAAV